tara:strand:- start:110 stop:268 length:159 start_codon:yes stop_codon:yes gene_type:complete
LNYKCKFNLLKRIRNSYTEGGRYAYGLDLFGESWVINITDSEGDMFALTKID